MREAADHDRTQKFTAGLNWLAEQFGTATRAEFGRQFPPDGPALLDGLVSLGYARFRPKSDDYALTEAGYRRERAKPAQDPAQA